MDERVRLAGELYERAIFNGEAGGLTKAHRELDAAEAELVLARGKVLHGRFLDNRAADPRELKLFERALALYNALGDERGKAEALFWIGCCHQVVRDDIKPAVSALNVSRALAEKSGDDLTLAYALRHLGIAAHTAGDLDEARALLEQSTAIRRALGFTAGVAANLVGLMYVARAQGRLDDAHSLADEAANLAGAVGATTVLGQVSEARWALKLTSPGSATPGGWGARLREWCRRRGLGRPRFRRGAG
ncbi:tetratricopeptide repeat protein [Kribbella sp. NPDC050124]|uniref:tetratricopeptide repeat protein n=1 Tax=Kribbella sp. NPDC050124 TaxID=3364114 RepID=UPI003793F3C6